MPIFVGLPVLSFLHSAGGPQRGVHTSVNRLSGIGLCKRAEKVFNAPYDFIGERARSARIHEPVGLKFQPEAFSTKHLQLAWEVDKLTLRQRYVSCSSSARAHARKASRLPRKRSVTEAPRQRRRD
jgi:hypothetical protein